MEDMYPNSGRSSHGVHNYRSENSQTHLGFSSGESPGNTHVVLAENEEKEGYGTWRRRSFSEGRTSTATEGDSPYSMVRAVVPPRDNTQVPSLTFRSIFLGILFSCALAYVNQLLWFKTTPILIGGFATQIISFPCGYVLAKILPTKVFSTFGYRWSFNPGPFSIKEHAMIYICASTASSAAYAIDIIVVENVYYHKSYGYAPAFLLTISSLMLGYSYAGIVREVLVYPAAMIWPTSLVNVTLFRTFHEADTTLLHGVSRVKFFWIVFGCSFVWYFIPGYVMPFLSLIPVLCFIAPNNIYANQLGDAVNGLGFLNFTFDWSVMSSSFMGSPIAMPWYMACNIFVGFVIIMWIIVPAGYYSNVWNSGYLPIYSSSVHRANGSTYSVTAVIGADGLLDKDKYDAYGPPRLPFQLAIAYGLQFMCLTSLITYTALHHGKDIYDRLKIINLTNDDIHAKLMRKYDEVPKWWYIITFVVMFAMAIGVCEGYKMLPWYWLILAFVIAFLFLIPVGIVQALSNQQPGLNVITELIIGYGKPGDALSNVTFKVFGYISMAQALALLADQKMGHYMKIPPRHVFIAQMVGSVVSAIVQPTVAIWMLRTIRGVCTQQNSEWSCPAGRTFYTASVIWGLVGPGRLFGQESDYNVLLYTFVIGALLPIPVWFMQRRYPLSIWKHINIPVLLIGTGRMPPASITTITSWFLCCFVFNFVIYRYRYKWWQKYAFALSAALDSSVGVAAVLIYLIFNLTDIKMPKYFGTETTHCKLVGRGFKNYQ